MWVLLLRLRGAQRLQTVTLSKQPISLFLQRNRVKKSGRRLLSNSAIEIWTLFPYWFIYMIAQLLYGWTVRLQLG